MKKTIFAICIFLSLIIISIICYRKFISNNTKFNYELEVVTEIKYRVISENNKFGVINENGDVLVSPIYDEIDIPNPSKPIFICMYNYNIDNQQYSIKVLNDKAEQILYQYVIVEAIKINPIISEIPYEKSVLKYKQDCKYGLIDLDGNVIVKPKYEQIDSLDYKEGLLLVKKDEKYGVINIKGDIVIKTKYDTVKTDGYYEEGVGFNKIGFIIGNKINEEYKLGYIDFKGNQILDIKYNQIERIQNISSNEDTYLVAFENGKAGFYKNKENIIKHEYEDIVFDLNNNCLILQKNSKQGISNINGNIEIDIKYDNIFISGKYINAFNEGNIDIYNYITKQKLNYNNIIAINETLNEKYAIVITDKEKHKILDLEKNEIKIEEYDYLEHLYEDYFIANINDKYGIVNINGNEVVKFKYDFIQKISKSKIVQGINYKANSIDLINLNKVIVTMKNANVYVGKDFLNMQSDKDSVYIDFDGNILENTSVLDCKLYAIEQNSKWGFINKNGEIIVEPEYDFVTEFNELGFAGIQKDGKWGSININGEVVIEPCYEIEWDTPMFIGKYYEVDLGYGVPYFVCE